MISFVDRLCDRGARVLEIVLALAFLLAILLNFTNVIGRYLLGRSLLWADEVQIFIMIAMTFLGAAVVTWRRQHLRMDVIAQLLPGPVRMLLRIAELILMLVLAAFVFLQSQDYALRMLDIGRTSDTAGVPMWIPHGSLAIGFALIALVCVWQLVSDARNGFAEPVQPRPPAESQEGPR